LSVSRINSECHLLFICLIWFYFDFITHKAIFYNITVFIDILFDIFMRFYCKVIYLFPFVRPPSGIKHQTKARKCYTSTYYKESDPKNAWTLYIWQYLNSKRNISNIVFYCFGINMDNLGLVFHSNVNFVCLTLIAYRL